MAGHVPGYEGRPSRIYDYVTFVGELFFLGAAGGAAFHFAKGLRGAPGGGAGARLAGAVHAVRANVPLVAGAFGAYCVAFSAIEGAVSLARGREDMWSSTAAAAATWGLHSVRRGGGAPAAARCALLGATGFLALKGIDQIVMVWESRRADDADLLLRRKRMMDRGQPATPAAPLPQDGRLLGFSVLVADDHCCRDDGFQHG